MKYILKKINRNTSSEDFLADISRVAGKLGKNAISMADYLPHGKYHPATISRRFGSWNTALEKAGLAVKKHQKLTEADLVRNLKKVWDSLGRQPRNTEMSKPLSDYTASVYSRRWGSWIKALEAFVEYMNSENKITDAKSGIAKSRKVKPRKTPRNVSTRLRFLVMQRDNFKCRMCGSSPAHNPEVKLEIDHIKPWAKGGETVPANLQTLCSICNNGKADTEVK
jgi:hypothetical protein